MTKRKIVYNLSVKRPSEKIKVRPGIHHVFVIKRPTLSIDVLEAEDVLFRFNSAVFLPDIMDQSSEDEGQATDEQLHVGGLAVLSGFFRYVQLCYDRGENKYILVTGHTDSVGSESGNTKLSKRRAEVVLSLILGGKDAREIFVDHVINYNTVEDQQQIMAWVASRLSQCSGEKKDQISTIPGWWEVDPGLIDGVIGEKTIDAIFAFKMAFSKNFPPPKGYEGVIFPDDLQEIKDALKPGSVFGKNLWAAVFEIYQAELQRGLIEDGLALHDIRKLLLWVDDNKKAVGCGETWPIDIRGGEDNYRSQSNRRVEILLYDPYELGQCLPQVENPPIDEDDRHILPCKDGTCKEADCHIFKNLDRPDETGDEKLSPNLRWKYLSINEKGKLLGRLDLLTDVEPGDDNVKFVMMSPCGYHKKVNTDDFLSKDTPITVTFLEMPTYEKYSLNMIKGGESIELFRDVMFEDL